MQSIGQEGAKGVHSPGADDGWHHVVSRYLILNALLHDRALLNNCSDAGHKAVTLEATLEEITSSELPVEQSIRELSSTLAVKVVPI